MAVTSLVVSRENPPSSRSDERFRGVHQISYEAMTNSTMAPAKVVNEAVASFSLPTAWSGYNYGGHTEATSVLRSYDVRLKNAAASQYLWLITCEWGPLEDGEDNNQDETNPLNRSAQYAWEDEVYTKVVDKDRENKAILNSAKKPFDEPLEIEETRGVLVVSINVADLGACIFYNRRFQNAVNRTTWNIGSQSAPPRTVLCRSVSASRLQTENSYTYYSLEFRFAFKEDGDTWDEKILNRGLMKQIVNLQPDGDPATADDFDWEVIKDNKGNVITEPVMLDENGMPLKKDAEPTYSTYRVRREVDFAGLPF
jgi:hypothetical protein